MNDLFSASSFKKYTDLKRQVELDDVELGSIPPTASEAGVVDLSKFFTDVDVVKEDIKELEKHHKRLQELNEEAKVAHNANTVKTLRSHMDKMVNDVLRLAKSIKAKLEALDRSNIAHRNLPGCGQGSSSDRTRMSVVAGLGKNTQTLMEDFQTLRQKISSEYKETVERRYFTLTGQHPDEATLETLISSGESETLVQRAIQEQGRGQVMDTLSEIQERHGAVQELEKSLMDLHQVFLDMAVLVEVQGKQLDNIESHVAHASSFVRSGVAEVQLAKVYQKSSRKWMCIGIIIVLVVVVVVVVPVVVSFTRN